MTRLTGALLGVLGVVVLTVGAVLGGFVPLPGLTSPARPPCEALPTAAEVRRAVERHGEATSGLLAAGGTEVSVSRPCSGEHADRALVRVTVPDAEALDRVSRWLETHDGYGVPLEVEVA